MQNKDVWCIHPECYDGECFYVIGTEGQFIPKNKKPTEQELEDYYFEKP